MLDLDLPKHQKSAPSCVCSKYSRVPAASELPCCKVQDVLTRVKSKAVLAVKARGVGRNVRRVGGCNELRAVALETCFVSLPDKK